MALCLKLDEGGAEDRRVIQLCVRMNRDPEVHQVILHHLHHELLLTSTTTKMTSCHPNHGLQDLISEPEVHPVVLDHLQHHLVLPGTTMMISCPPKPWPPRPDQGTRGSSSRNAPPSAPSCVNWDDDDDDFMPPNLGLQDRIREPEIRPSLQTLVQHHPMRTRMTM